MQVGELQRKKKWDEAITLLSEVMPALQANDDKASAYEMRGKALDKKGEHDRAIAD